MRNPLTPFLVLGVSVTVLPKLLFGHCIFHLLGISEALGYDPLHALAEALGLA